MPQARPLTAADRDAVRDDFLSCYDSLLAQKTVVLEAEEGEERKLACDALMGSAVRSFFV
jgi:hypothetical protein